MPKAVRMADIAAKIGVSTVTVSKALAGKDGVSEEIREKIKEMAVKMGYSTETEKKYPKKTGNIGILIPSEYIEKNRSFYWKMYENLIKRLTSLEYYGILEILQRDIEKQIIEPRIIQDGKIDGLIVIGQTSSAYRDMLCKNKKVPIMFLDSYDAIDGNNSIISDGYYGMYMVTSHLIQLGHRDIWFIGNMNVTSSISDRLFGYKRAMAEHGFTVTPEMILSDRDENGRFMIQLPDSLPTAFACNCDAAACETINKLRERNISVPDDISVAGFDDYVPELTTFAITTYAVDTDSMARTCIDRLLKKIRNPNYISTLKIVSGHLIIRDSTKNVNK